MTVCCHQRFLRFFLFLFLFLFLFFFFPVFFLLVLLFLDFCTSQFLSFSNLLSPSSFPFSPTFIIAFFLFFSIALISTCEGATFLVALNFLSLHKTRFETQYFPEERCRMPSIVICSGRKMSSSCSLPSFLAQNKTYGVNAASSLGQNGSMQWRVTLIYHPLSASLRIDLWLY